jgi:hypothetical protein
MTFRVTYTNDKAAGLLYSFDVEARDEEHAAMVGGMARAESFTNWFFKSFYWPDPITWRRVSIERIS